MKPTNHARNNLHALNDSLREARQALLANERGSVREALLFLNTARAHAQALVDADCTIVVTRAQANEMNAMDDVSYLHEFVRQLDLKDAKAARLQSSHRTPPVRRTHRRTP
jgi:hypothetical protein